MSDVFGPAALAAGQAISAFSTFLPPISRVRAASRDADPDIAADVRMGMVAATAIAFGVGALASSLSGSPVPMYAAFFMVLVLACVYEAALRADRPFEPKRVDAVAVSRNEAR